jgi:hypothetical protein
LKNLLWNLILGNRQPLPFPGILTRQTQPWKAVHLILIIPLLDHIGLHIREYTPGYPVTMRNRWTVRDITPQDFTRPWDMQQQQHQHQSL